MQLKYRQKYLTFDILDTHLIPMQREYKPTFEERLREQTDVDVDALIE